MGTNINTPHPFRAALESMKALRKHSPEEKTETTHMTRVYKMPVLAAFHNGGRPRMCVSEADLLAVWKDFFDKDEHWRDLGTDITLADYRAISDEEHLKNILRNPVHYLHKSGKDFFLLPKGGNPVMSLSPRLASAVDDPAFAAEMGDIIAYRTEAYFRRRGMH